MKVIDLLNKIANGEELPKKFKYDDNIYCLKDNKCYYACYICDETNDIFEECFVFEILNDEIEIIEDTPKKDKKIEKINTLVLSEYYTNDELETYIFKAQVKINEIIDKVNKI